MPIEREAERGFQHGNPSVPGIGIAKCGTEQVRIAQGGGDRYETRKIRPDPNEPVDILGSGLVVAAPSCSPKSEYKPIRGRIEDLEARKLSELGSVRSRFAGILRTESNDDFIGEGNRNKALFRYCMREAHTSADLYDLRQKADKYNASRLTPPLPSIEVIHTSKSAWKYTSSGRNQFGKHGAFLDAEFVNRLSKEGVKGQDALVLFAYLKANNRPERTFLITNTLSQNLHWSLRRLQRARPGL